MNEFNTGPLTLEETMKVFSLLENPPEAAMVRKALKFYEIPTDLEFKWGHNKDMMTIMRHFDNPQQPWELAQMLKIVAGKRSLLEIGSSFGGTLRRMASVMPKGSLIVSVDLPCDETPKALNPLDTLKDVCRKIGLMGGNVELFVGDSHDEETVAAVRKYTPFEFGFIDGDHSYAGVKADWENYGPMCGIVGFHDIAGTLGCADLWRELKTSGQYVSEEFIHPESTLGIGIIYRNGSRPPIKEKQPFLS